MKTITLSLLVALLSSSLSFAHATSCQDVKQKLKPSSELFQFVDYLADYHVYYGSISTKKTSSIFNAYLVRECTQGKKFGGIVRFQVKAQGKDYFCYSKFYINSQNNWFNNGTFCSRAKQNLPASISFPYGTSADPYYDAGRGSVGDIDRPGEEFPTRNGGGLNDRQDPFYETREDNGPDSRNDWVR